MNKILFKEEQQFRQWWYILLVVVSVIPLTVMGVYVLIQQGIKGIPVGNNPGPTWISGLMLVAAFGLLWMSYVMRLEVWIDQSGIRYRFFPMIRKIRLISKEEIAGYEIRTYNAIIDYGGWGIKGSLLSRKGTAFNVSGNKGLQLYLKNGKKVLFGTQRSQAILYAMDEIMRSSK